MTQATVQQTDEMDGVVERLRASKQESDKRMFEDGRAAGREWAKHEAEAEETPAA